jgi:ABC-type transporter Mla maintaining outer membrane lipid asymmetry permease subunit MlaE
MTRKKIIGVVVGVMLAIIGAIFGVDVSSQKASITDQVEHAVIEGQAQQSIPALR